MSVNIRGERHLLRSSSGKCICRVTISVCSMPALCSVLVTVEPIVLSMECIFLVMSMECVFCAQCSVSVLVCQCQCAV